jgi:hypothetical protein
LLSRAFIPPWSLNEAEPLSDQHAKMGTGTLAALNETPRKKLGAALFGYQFSNHHAKSFKVRA